MKSQCALPGLAITLAFLSLSGSPSRADAETLADLRRRTLEESRQDALERVDKPLRELEAKYQAALEKRVAAAQVEGKLEAVLEAKDEIKRIEEGNTGLPELKDPETAKLQRIYLDARNKLMGRIKPKRVNIDRKHAKDLGVLVTELTKAGMLEEAKRALEFQKLVLANLGKGTRADLPAQPPSPPPVEEDAGQELPFEKWLETVDFKHSDGQIYRVQKGVMQFIRPDGTPGIRRTARIDAETQTLSWTYAGKTASLRIRKNRKSGVQVDVSGVERRMSVVPR